MLKYGTVIALLYWMVRKTSENVRLLSLTVFEKLVLKIASDFKV